MGLLVINCSVAITMATCSEITIKKVVRQAASEIGFALKPKQIEAVVFVEEMTFSFRFLLDMANQLYLESCHLSLIC